MRSEVGSNILCFCPSLYNVTTFRRAPVVLFLAGFVRRAASFHSAVAWHRVAPLVAMPLRLPALFVCVSTIHATEYVGTVYSSMGLANTADTTPDADWECPERSYGR